MSARDVRQIELVGLPYIRRGIQVHKGMRTATHYQFTGFFHGFAEVTFLNLAWRFHIVSPNR